MRWVRHTPGMQCNGVSSAEIAFLSPFCISGGWGRMRHPLWPTSAGWGWGWELSPCLLGARWARASRCAPRPHRVPSRHLGTPERAQRGPQPRVSLGSPWWHSPALPTWQGRARRPLLDEASPGPTPKKTFGIFLCPSSMERGGSARCIPIGRPGGASFKAPPPPIRCPDFQHLAVEKWQGRVWQRSLAQIIQQLFPILRPRLPHPPVTMTKSGVEPAPAAGVLRSGTAQKYLLSGTNIYQPFCLLFLWFSYFFSRHSLAKCHIKQQPRNFGVAAWLLWALFFSRANC